MLSPSAECLLAHSANQLSMDSLGRGTPRPYVIGQISDASVGMGRALPCILIKHYSSGVGLMPDQSMKKARDRVIPTPRLYYTSCGLALT